MKSRSTRSLRHSNPVHSGALSFSWMGEIRKKRQTTWIFLFLLLTFPYSCRVQQLHFQRDSHKNSSRTIHMHTLTQQIFPNETLYQSVYRMILFLVYVSLYAINIWHNSVSPLWQKGYVQRAQVNITITRHAINCHQTEINSDLLFLPIRRYTFSLVLFVSCQQIPFSLSVCISVCVWCEIAPLNELFACVESVLFSAKWHFPVCRRRRELG